MALLFASFSVPHALLKWSGVLFAMDLSLFDLVSTAECGEVRFESGKV